jgi:hypothetical protein
VAWVARAYWPRGAGTVNFALPLAAGPQGLKGLHYPNKDGYTTSGTVLVQGPNKRLKSEIQIGSELTCHIESRLPIRVRPHSHDMP